MTREREQQLRTALIGKKAQIQTFFPRTGEIETRKGKIDWVSSEVFQKGYYTLDINCGDGLTAGITMLDEEFEDLLRRGIAVPEKYSGGKIVELK